jgi:small ligand-binding sensory domain FIST
VSREDNVRVAAADAAGRALAQAGLSEAGCLFVAATAHHLDEAIDLCASLREAAGPRARIVGGAAAAVMTLGDAAEEGPALGVLALEGPAMPFSFTPGNAASLHAAARTAGPGALGLVFADPGASLPQLLAALSREAPAIRFAGGGVSAEGGVLLDDDLADAMAVGLLVPGGARVAVAQSQKPVGKPFRVTRAEGRLLHELDGKPALEALAALAELPGLEDLDEALQFVAVGAATGPGEVFREDDFLTLPILGVREDLGALELGGKVVEGTQLTFTLRDGMGARRSLTTALSALPSGSPAFGVYFDCASRGTTLYGVPGLDLSLIEKQLGRFPLLALRTSFEVGPLGGAVGLHLFSGVLGLSGEPGPGARPTPSTA